MNRISVGISCGRVPGRVRGKCIPGCMHSSTKAGKHGAYLGNASSIV